MRDPSSYTPIRPDLIPPGGPKSLTLGMCGKLNKEQIGQFSARDAVKYEEYEHQLEQFVKAVDPLLDAAAVDVKHLAESSLMDKLKFLKENWQLVKAAKILGPHASAFYELMTAPTTKILDKWYVISSTM